MSSLTTEATIHRSRGALWRGIALAIGLAAVIGGCSSAAATSSPTAVVAGATATPTASPTAVASPTPTDTPTPAATPAATPTPAPKATPKATPLPPLGVGLCKSSQLKLTIDYWVGSSGNPTYPHISVKNISSASCNMRGRPRAQIIDGSGKVIVDSGNGGIEISTGDPIQALAPGGVSYNFFDW